jgi:hypothetical protein
MFNRLRDDSHLKQNKQQWLNLITIYDWAR